MRMEVCKKVSFINESFAMQYIEKLQKTSCRKRKPINAYLCEKCLAWHLTSVETNEDKKASHYTAQIDNLKRKNIHLQNEINRLNKIIIKNK